MSASNFRGAKGTTVFARDRFRGLSSFIAYSELRRLGKLRSIVRISNQCKIISVKVPNIPEKSFLDNVASLIKTEVIGRIRTFFFCNVQEFYEIEKRANILSDITCIFLVFYRIIILIEESNRIENNDIDWKQQQCEVLYAFNELHFIKWIRRENHVFCSRISISWKSQWLNVRLFSPWYAATSRSHICHERW